VGVCAKALAAGARVMTGEATNQHWRRTMWFPSVSLVRRELLSLLRLYRSFIPLLLFVAVTSAVVLLNWPENVVDLGHAARLSEGVAIIVVALQCAACLLFVPGLSALAFVSEKEQGTLDFLRMSLISTVGILFGKWMNAVGWFVLVLLAGLPIVSTTFFLIGLDWQQIVMSYVIILAVAVPTGMAGMLCSLRFRHTVAAVIGGYVLAFIINGGPTLLLLSLSELSRFRIAGDLFEDYLYFTVPPALLVFNFEESLTWRMLFGELAYLAAMTFGLGLMAYYVYRQPPRVAQVETYRPIDDMKWLKARRNTYPFYLIDPLRRKKPIEDGRNAMMVKELRWGLFGKLTRMVRTFYVVFILAVLVGTTILFRNGDVQIWVMVQVAGLMFMTPTLLANSFTKEYELQNIDMLRMTLMRGRDLVMGKLVAGLLLLSPFYLALLASSIPLVPFGMSYNHPWWYWLAGYLTIVGCLALAVSSSLYVSIVARRTSVSLILSYIVLVLLLFGGPMLIVLAESLGMHVSEESLGAISLVATSPIFGYIFHTFQPTNSPMDTVWFWLTSVVFALIVSQLFVWMSIRHITRRRMQDR
jgi:ABC-type transport system involved in multi-copper enzyme maturation permease subunit